MLHRTKTPLEDPPAIAGRQRPADRGLAVTIPAEQMWKVSRRAQPRSKRVRTAARAVLLGDRPEPHPAFRGVAEDPREGSIGICCSGGGIRSAAFNLGALQALQTDGTLKQADYLAAVSGGAYIAAAFAMVGKTWRGDRRPQPGQIGHDDSDPSLIDETPPFAPGSPEEQYLRNRSSYMAPDAAGKVGLGMRLLLGLLFNIVFLSLPIVGLTILAGVAFYAPTLDELRGGDLALPDWMLIVPAAVAAAGMVLALAHMLIRPRHDATRRFLHHWSVVLLAGGAAIALASLALPAAVALVGDGSAAGGPDTQPVTAGGLGLASLVAGLLAHIRSAVGSPVGAAKQIGRLRTRLNARLRRMLIFTAGAIAGPLVLFSAAVGALTYTLGHYDAGGSNAGLLWMAAIMLAAFVALYAAADLTNWSLHPFYRRRLCTAFALKRVGHEDAEGAPACNAHELVSGVAVERRFDGLMPLSSTAIDDWPTLLVCAAANVSDSGATPPGRRVTSFTFSAGSIGGPLTGGLSTVEFQKAFKRRRRRDFSLPAAVAMSGAALSPSMGKMTRPSLRFLLALANIRLGVWVPNPRWVAGTSRRQRACFGRPRPLHLLFELLGCNRVDAKYLYVTDGGHYENLGLVELLRRGCTRIYCFDASGGRSFAELGDAVALARSELGVEIDINPLALTPRGTPPTAQSCVVAGTLRYRSGETGTIVYARNVVSNGAPWDVRAHQRDDPRFPDDSTMDQLYTDQKFESYRALGELGGKRALALMRQRDAAVRGARLRAVGES